MRLLDPNLLTSETGKILVRDNAIVFAMEHIRLIISATTVIIPRDGFEQNLLNARFNALLEESIIEASQEKQHRESRLQHLREIAESDIDDDTSSGELACLPDLDAANETLLLLLLLMLQDAADAVQMLLPLLNQPKNDPCYIDIISASRGTFHGCFSTPNLTGIILAIPTQPVSAEIATRAAKASRGQTASPLNGGISICQL